MNNNYAFIDGQNLHEAVKNFKWRLCYEKLNFVLKNTFNVSKAFYFVGYTQSRNWKKRLIILQPAECKSFGLIGVSMEVHVCILFRCSDRRVMR